MVVGQFHPFIDLSIQRFRWYPISPSKSGYSQEYYKEMCHHNDIDLSEVHARTGIIIIAIQVRSNQDRGQIEYTIHQNPQYRWNTWVGIAQRLITHQFPYGWMEHFGMTLLRPDRHSVTVWNDSDGVTVVAITISKRSCGIRYSYTFFSPNIRRTSVC